MAKIDGDKPEVAAETVEYTAYARILLLKACKLAVGAVKRIGPYQQ